MVRGLVHLHLAVGFAVLTVCLVWPTLFTSSARCDSRLLLPSPDCRYDIAAHGVSRTLAGIAVAAAALVLAAAVVSAVQHTRDAPDVAGRPAPSKGWLLWLSMAVLAYAELVILVRRPDVKVAANLPGVSERLTALLVLMLSLAAGSLFLRISRVASWAWAVVLGGAAIASVSFTPWGTAVVGVVLVAFLVQLGLAGDRGSRRWQAWRGSAPGVFLGTAVLAQGILSSVIVLLAGDWLNGSHGASTLIPRVRPVTKPLELGPVRVVCPGQDPFLDGPAAVPPPRSGGGADRAGRGRRGHVGLPPVRGCARRDRAARSHRRRGAQRETYCPPRTPRRGPGRRAGDGGPPPHPRRGDDLGRRLAGLERTRC